jgi:hypothetical protein
MKDIKVNYDKKLKKYHIQYHKSKDHFNFRSDFYNTLNQKSDLFMLIETHLGSVSNPTPLDYTRTIEEKLKQHNLDHHIRPVQVRTGKSIFGIIGKGKPIEDFSIAFIIPKGTMNASIFEDFFTEFDVQVSYNFKQPIDQVMNDYIKGYLKASDDDAYFEHQLFDSRIFEKILASENLFDND